MLDVIIPTILNSDPAVFKYTIRELQQCNVVGTIIIIDNTPEQSFEAFWDGSDDKILIVNGYIDELLVNAAWNKGIELCTSEYYCLLNDDILVDSDVISITYQKFISSPFMTLLTIKTINDIGIEEYGKSLNIFSNVSITNDIPNRRQGWFIIGKVSEYVPIPKQLRLFYGDDWIYACARNRGRVAMITNLTISHFQSSSINKNLHKLRAIINQDTIEWIALNG